jgi:hypothetical protein
MTAASVETEENTSPEFDKNQEKMLEMTYI